jgi:hypothetical protein
MSDQLTLDDAGLRKKIEQILARTPQTQIATIGSIISQDEQNKQRPVSGYGYTAIMGGSAQLAGRELGRLQDIVWVLIIEGHVRPGLGDGLNNDLPCLHVTAKGKQLFQNA